MPFTELYILPLECQCDILIRPRGDHWVFMGLQPIFPSNLSLLNQVQNHRKQGTHCTVPCTPWLHAHLTQSTMLLTKSWYQELIVKTLAHNSRTENQYKSSSQKNSTRLVTKSNFSVNLEYNKRTSKIRHIVYKIKTSY